MSSTLPSPVILLGCRRSGTTLLRKIFSKHPDVSTPPDEPQFMLDVYKQFGHTINNKVSSLEYITNHKYLLDPIDLSKLNSVYLEQIDNSSKALIHTIFDLWWDDRDCNTLILKHPAISYENNLSIIHEIFPDATYINLIRDPRGNISSQLARWHRDSIWRCIRLWKQSINNLTQWENNISKEKYIEVQYEDLIYSLEDTLNSICNRIDVRFTTEMLEFKSPGRRWSPGGNESRVERKSVDKSRTDIWKENLTKQQIQIIEICCEAEIIKYNYQLSENIINPYFKYYVLFIYKIHNMFYMFKTRIKNIANIILRNFNF